jgi:hypothetical protein
VHYQYGRRPSSSYIGSEFQFHTHRNRHAIYLGICTSCRTYARKSNRHKVVHQRTRRTSFTCSVAVLSMTSEPIYSGGPRSLKTGQAKRARTGVRKTRNKRRSTFSRGGVALMAGCVLVSAAAGGLADQDSEGVDEGPKRYWESPRVGCLAAAPAPRGCVTSRH